MKPPTKDWSSEHQSPSCKSSLFQTSGVLIQTPPRGELLVRNQYSSWGVLWPTLYKDPWSLKKYLSWKRVEKFIRSILYRPARWASYATVSKFRTGSPSQSYIQGHFNICKSCFYFEKKINHLKASHCFQLRVVNGNMINNYTNSNFPSPDTPQALQPLPPVLSLCRVFWFKFHCGIRLCCGLGFTSHFLFLALTCFRAWIRINSFHTELWYQAVLPSLVDSVRKLIRNPQWGQNLSPKSLAPDHVTEIQSNIKTEQLV